MDILQIEQLTIHSQQAPIGARLKVENLLQTMRLQPHGMPVGAILLVRELKIIAPLDTRRMFDFQWEQQVRDVLTQHYHKAYRPQIGDISIAPHHESIYFPDAVQMLTCITTALHYQSNLWHSWIIRQLLPYLGTSALEAVVSLWQEHITALPNAIVQLAPYIRELILTALPDTVIHNLIVQLHDVYHLGVIPNFTDFLPSTNYGVADNSLTQTSSQPTTIPIERHYFLVLCHALGQRPSWVQSRDFQKAVAGMFQQSMNAHLASDQDSLLSMTLLDDMHDITDTPNLLTIGNKFTGQSIPTQLGGVFYLIHALHHLQLPADEQAPYISSWAMLEGLARLLLGDQYHDYKKDAIWSLLRELDGRAEDVLLAAEWQPENTQSTPQHWQLPKSDSTAEPNKPTTPKLLEGVAAPFAAWLQHNQAIIHTLLEQVLATDALDFLAKPATVYLSRTHIDVQQSLNNIDMTMRRAGWDMNPNWQPEFGYIIYFHFLED